MTTPKIKEAPPSYFPGSAKDREHPLVKAGLHYKDADGCVQNQAEIVTVMPSNNATVGDLALIQYFEWAIGGNSTRRLVPLAELASSDRWVLYRSVEEMNDHYERVDHSRNRQIRAEKSGDTDGPA